MRNVRVRPESDIDSMNLQKYEADIYILIVFR
jgi:hypothetical protein